MSLRSQQIVPQNSLSALHTQTKQCIARYDYPGAIQVLQRAHKLDPDNDRILADLGSAQAKAYDFAAAEQSFEHAVRISRMKPDALLAVGHYWLEVRHYEAAIKYFQQILKESRIPVLTFVRLGEIFIRMRRLDDAVAIAERALRLYSQNESALLLRAKVHREQKQLADAERLLRMVTAKIGDNAEVRAGAWYELAAILDQQGQYDQAMAALLEAKALMRLTAGQAMKILRTKQGHLKQMQENVSATMVQRWRQFGTTDLQPSRRLALLCGHARSGTTLLEYVLDSHPQIVSADETSVYHNTAYNPIGRAVSSNSSFVSALEWIPARNMRQIRTDYFRGIESFLGQPIGDRLLVDKNPANTFDIPSIARIFPEQKFLVALRDPRDVCLSCFMQPVAILPDTASWLTLEGTMEHYALIMGLWQAWKPCLGAGAIEVRYEDMVENLEATTRPVLDFLGLPWDERLLRFNEHASGKIVRSPTFAEVTKPIFKSALGRWRNYQKYFEPHLEKLKPSLKAFGYA
ncbi:tetratricopeptide repeat-containing sulfotransferase family protein [Pedosphaera parvula]|uniref:Sulfotransferase n=1 Tax=Pedosphaera parvula (strain Ellin514) TaxID=320771 RepID=B9XKG9_PEDPL|nr:sulfotransferase [Pedosphaera parvula]EEF59639.1 sulfotransferase [Pedosphaera parvula Ellin514]